MSPFGESARHELTKVRTCPFPSGLRRPRGSNTMPSADFSEHGVRCRKTAPLFTTSLTHGYASEISPNKGRSCCQEHVICPCPSATSTSAPSSGSVSLSAASSPGVVGLNVVSVRHLAGLGENVADNDLAGDACPIQSLSNRTIPGVSQLYEHIRRLPPHGSSPPRSCPHLVLSFTSYPFGIMTPVRETGTKYRGLAPTRSRPCWAYCNGAGLAALFQWAINSSGLVTGHVMPLKLLSHSL